MTYTLQQLQESFSYDPDTGELKRLKRNNGQIVTEDVVRIFFDGKLHRLSTTKVCYSLATGIINTKRIYKINPDENNKLSNLTTTKPSNLIEVVILPSTGKKPSMTRVRWRVGKKYAQKTLQTPSAASEFAKMKERELREEFGV